MKLLRSVDGYTLPEAGERGVYWAHMDYTDVYAADGFTGKFDDDLSGGEYHAPEIICPR
jgi:hypothetical protein